jgi:galactokinase
VVCNTNVRHELASSAYNERRAQCELAVRLLRELVTGIRALRDVTIFQYEQWNDVMLDVIARRCHHVITENDRTLRAAAALSENNTEEFGKLTVESHQSLRDDFEVSCTELDAMVAIALSHRVFPARG